MATETVLHLFYAATALMWLLVVVVAFACARAAGKEMPAQDS